ncbi:MAG TPA: hypothetical protein IAC41_06645 [Candidatus Merdenecus merdavium]|nr:hypothetical protein [Candidatus Merdenecus merdavium]
MVNNQEDYNSTLHFVLKRMEMCYRDRDWETFNRLLESYFSVLDGYVKNIERKCGRIDLEEYIDRK